MKLNEMSATLGERFIIGNSLRKNYATRSRWNVITLAAFDFTRRGATRDCRSLIKFLTQKTEFEIPPLPKVRRDQLPAGGLSRGLP
jgi:hypothetical protein